MSSISKDVHFTDIQKIILSLAITWITVAISAFAFIEAIRMFLANSHVALASVLTFGGAVIQPFRHYAVKWLSED